MAHSACTLETMARLRDERLYEERDAGRIAVRTNKAERWLIEEAARRQGISASDLLRLLVLNHCDQERIVLPPKLD